MKTAIKKYLSIVVLAIAAILTPGSAQALTVIGDIADNGLNEDNSLATASGTSNRVGSSSGQGGGRAVLFVFQLPNLGAVSSPFASADFQLTLSSLTNTPFYNADLYGLGRQSTSTLTIGSGVLSTNRYYESATPDPSATVIQQSLLVIGNGAGVYNTDSSGDINLLSFLNAQYASGTGAGEYVIFRLNTDADGGSAARGYNIASADNLGNEPLITYTTAVPEPTTPVLLGLGLGILFFVRRKSRAS